MIYITGCMPTIIHLDAKCIGVIGKPRIVDMNKLSDKELQELFLACRPCCVCASEYTGDKEKRRKELWGLSHQGERRQ